VPWTTLVSWVDNLFGRLAAMLRKRRPASSDAAFLVPPHLRHSSGALVVWLTEPPGAVVQLTRPVRGTADLAEWLVGPAFEHLIQYFPDALRLIVVFDLRQMTGRDSSARALLIDKGKTLRASMLHAVVIPPVGASPAYHSSLRVAAAILRVYGVRVDIERSLTKVLSEQGLRGAGLTPVSSRPWFSQL
jgi:hypothetical protein